MNCDGNSANYRPNLFQYGLQLIKSQPSLTPAPASE